ncbi:MAG: cyclic nucleotide-binding domain-containing protein, partial [Mariprofundus sp.]|nr:cyclic nucleotide-binding domain-containing protein [Mariprofundus sp.]
HTYRSEGFVEVLSIPSKLYADFVQVNNLYNDIERLGESWQFLENLPLLNEAISHLTLNKLVKHIVLGDYPAKHRFDAHDNCLYLIKSGKVELRTETRFETIEAGDFFGELCMFGDDQCAPVIQTSEASEVYRLPIDLLKNIPILNWKLFERHQKRIHFFSSEQAG